MSERSRFGKPDPTIDFLPPEVLRLAGRLGMISCPGRRWPIQEELAVLRERNVDLLVSLIQDHEAQRFGIYHWVEVAAEVGLPLARLPTIDGGVPELAPLSALVDRILNELGAGSSVVIHCLAGLGRTGTVVACCLVASGLDADRAIREVRRARPGTIENATQAAFVREFAAQRAARR